MCPVTSFLANPLTTAKYEQYLDEIQNKSGQPDKLLDHLRMRLDKLSTFANLKFTIPINSESHKCPGCNAGALLKLKGKTGYFWKCQACNSNYTDNNDNPILVANNKLEAIKTGEKCPACKTGDLVLRDGKFGKFKACNGFPKCKHTKK